MPRVRSDAGNEAVVLIQAAKTELQQLLGTSFDVRRQDTGRCSRRALAASADIDEAHLRPPCAKLVRDGSADDAGADDRDLHASDFSR